ncbi:MAG: class III poly(R)-hydroxyalkanoic acid synthase subunit PhaC [Burkholderiaceae bacterium]|jgi:polyhydroxyalkanoate synthase
MRATKSARSTKGSSQNGSKFATSQLTPLSLLSELAEIREKLQRGSQRLSEVTEEQLAIATAPKDEVYREDMVRLYRYRPSVEPESPISILIAYALVGRYQMIDLEAERSFVRKLLAQGIRVYMVDWGEPKRVNRWLTIDDYVSGYLDNCVDVIREREGIDKVNLLGVCQGGVLSACYAALFPHKVQNLVMTVTPIDFHGDKSTPEVGGGYMNLWARALSSDDIDTMIDTMGNASGKSVGFSFIMMNPVGNISKYTLDLIDVLDDERKLLNFLHMERWIADRPDSPGEFVRQWFKDLYQDNKLIRGELLLGGRKVDLRKITMPVLNISADGDVVIPTACSRGQKARFGTQDYQELAVPGGHIGTFVGGKAQAILAPSIVKWLQERN